MTELEEKAKEYGIKCHTATNHYYGDGLPYAYHLQMVNAYARKYLDLLESDEDKETALASTWVHDVIEDCRQTYNDVKTALNENVAEVAYALTNEKGRNRKERGNQHYYDGILANKVAHFVKICDRLANAEFSRQQGSSMLNAYRKEHDKFAQYLSFNPYGDMFDELRRILE